MNKDPSRTNKLKTGNIMSILKKTNESMTIRGQETANKISLFLKTIVNDRLSTAEESAVELYQIKGYINMLKPNKVPDRNHGRNISKNI